MKAISIFSAVIILFSLTAFAQSSTSDMIASTKQSVISVTNPSALHVLPSFPGGEDQLSTYLQTNINYPEQARKMGLEGVVRVVFDVDQKGLISNVRVEDGIHELCNQAVVKAIEGMPHWSPRIKNGMPVDSSVTLFVKYLLTP